MSIRPQPYARPSSYAARGQRFISRPPPSGGIGAGLGAGPSAGGIAGLIGGLAVPILCLGCLFSLAVVGLFATMIGAAAYMNKMQSQYRKNIQGAGTIIELNLMVLFCALFCSIYILSKHRRGVAST